MSVPPRFSCVLVGEESLLVRCAERLVERGHTIAAVVAAAPAITEWASRSGVRAIAPSEDLAAAVSDTPVDLLLSVANRRLLPASALRIARRAAVNFHDGPLPERAGLNVPVWSILEGATEHGVAWHVMTEGIDRGPIIASDRFPIAPDETTFTLNVKCYEAASASFEEVLDALESDSFAPVPQEGEGVLYRRNQRPSAGAVLDWSRPATELDRLVRALDFGPYANPVSLPALLTPAGVPFFVTDARVEPGVSASAGTVLESTDAGVLIAAADGALRLTGVVDERGATAGARGLADAGVVVGAPLPMLRPGEADALRARAEELARHETYWERALTGAFAPTIPYARPAESHGERRDLTAPAPAGLGALAIALQRSPTDSLATALAVYVARLTDTEVFALGLRTPESVSAASAWPLFSRVVPLSLTAAASEAPIDAARRVTAVLDAVRSAGTFARHLPARVPAIRDAAPFTPSIVLDLSGGEVASGPLTLHIADDGSSTWTFDIAVYDADDVRAMQQHVEAVVAAMTEGSPGTIADLNLLSDDERRRLASEAGRQPLPGLSIHKAFEAQVAATPDRVAVRFRGSEWTYGELDAWANRLANRLAAQGVGPGTRVGVGVRRSHELVGSLLGILKSGAAYVPLDPAFPTSRLELMAGDAGLAAVVTEASITARMPSVAVPVIDVDDPTLRDESPSRPAVDVSADSLAYVLYTSGSTGVPKGVMVEHGNVEAFFAGMDDRIDHDSTGTWLAVTSVSFDISVLELLWTLTRGFTVVVQPEDRGPFAPRTPAGVPSAMGMSLFYFASDEGGVGAAEKYGLLLDGARFADENGFEAVWTPERHFHAFGGLYPNPSVAGAAIAAVTRRVGVRAGSVVSPLHHPARIAEEWSVVDNLSGGRVGISFASGWQPNDFVLRPDAYADRKERFMDGIGEVRALWRGESRTYAGPGDSPVEVRTLPRPIQPELPTWVTAAGNPETFRDAGANGYNLLTHLLGQRVEELEEKIKLYREARADAGYDATTGRITLMLHTFVGESDDEVREIVREPMKQYLGSSFELIKAAAWDFPAFRKAADASGRAALETLSPEDLDDVLEFSFARYYETGALFGSPESCLRMLEKVRAIGVDEVACLIDFGVPAAAVRGMWPALARLRETAGEGLAGVEEPATLPDAIRAESATHLQCTPTQARLLVADPEGVTALAGLDHMMVGGEAFPGPLAEELKGAGVKRLTNLYGPTEATVWASAHDVTTAEGATVPLGSPLANYRLYVMDERRRPVPDGIAGELWIAGAGVARGYFGREELTGERFLPDPFHAGERMYATGDLVRRRRDGRLDFLGRLDSQVKIRGFRVELGEIEAALQSHPAIREAAATVREDSPGEARLVAYWVPANGEVPDRAAFRSYLEERLPAYMVPDTYVRLESLPMTPNRKLDRRALPAPVEARAAVQPAPSAPAFAGDGGGPQGDVHALEQSLSAIWRDVLGVDDVPPTANFFDLGGHSLLALQVQGRVREVLGHELRVVDLFRHSTVRALAAHIGARADAAPERVVSAGADRGAGRRAALLQRRR